MRRSFKNPFTRVSRNSQTMRVSNGLRYSVSLADIRHSTLLLHFEAGSCAHRDISYIAGYSERSYAYVHSLLGLEAGFYTDTINVFIVNSCSQMEDLG